MIKEGIASLALQKTRFGVAFFKSLASGSYLSCVLQKRSSNTGHIAVFTKRSYRPTLKLHLKHVEAEFSTE